VSLVTKKVVNEKANIVVDYLFHSSTRTRRGCAFPNDEYSTERAAASFNLFHERRSRLVACKASAAALPAAVRVDEAPSRPAGSICEVAVHPT
jgi:hypothetical protein